MQLLQVLGKITSSVGTTDIPLSAHVWCILKLRVAERQHHQKVLADTHKKMRGQGQKAPGRGCLTSFFLLEMLFSMSFTALADSESRRLTLAPDDEESCIISDIKSELMLGSDNSVCCPVDVRALQGPHCGIKNRGRELVSHLTSSSGTAPHAGLCMP